MENIVQLINNAIGWSILHSLWQGASIYIILFGVFLIFYTITSDAKYKIAYIAQLLVFGSFLFTFLKYLQVPVNLQETAISERQQLTLYLDYLQNKTWSITKLFPYIVALYSVGIVVQILLCTKSIQMLNRIKKSSTATLPQQWNIALGKILLENNISRKVKLLVSEYVTSPITIGFIKPLIIFPTAYINKISTSDAEAILLHEVAHIKRNDYFFNIILLTIETILFFNPFVWLISRHIKIEREQSCDDFVTTSIANPANYARTLLQIELLRQEYETSLALALSGNNKYDLFSRIKRINNKAMETKYTAFKHQLMAILCTSLTFIFIAWINPQPKETSPKKNSETITAYSQTIETVTNTQDTTKKTANPLKKEKRIIIKTDSTVTVLDDEKEIEEFSKKMELHSKDLEKHFESPEWKQKILKIEEYAKEIDQKFNSKEWKDKIAKIELNAQDFETHLNSPEFKNKIIVIEKNAKKIEEKFNSPEWKEKIAKIEANSKKVEDLINSPEFKNKIAKIEIQSKRLTDKFNSPEWQDKIKKLEDLGDFYNSEEFKAIHDKYQKELQNLKKQKGLQQ
jgi:bla regulator protein BlaR1